MEKKRSIGRPRKENPMDRSICVHMTEQEYIELVSMSYKLDKSMSEIARDAIRMYWFVRK